jgi:serine protease Do
MKKNWFKVAAFSLGLALFVPVSLLAQKEDKEVKIKEKRDVQQIIITRTGDNEKMVIEVNGDKVTINGKSVEEYKKEHGDISVHTNKYKDFDGLTKMPGMNAWTYNGAQNFDLFTEDANRAMLGVTTDKVEEGAKIESITKESGAEKAGLKENDIIIKVDDIKINGPDELTATIKKHKPGDKVSVTYLRDKKEQKTTAELTKWKGMGNFKVDMGNMDFEKIMPKVNVTPRFNGQQNWTWAGGSPKLGLSVQDTDDGKGVKVLEVDGESNAQKAGIKADDVITEVDGKAVNGADEMAKIIRESKDKVSIMVKLTRSGKTQSIEVKMPRKIKTADL